MSFRHPATIIVAGGTGSGKSVLTRAIIEHHRYTFVGMPEKPKVIWCYGIEQDSYSKPIQNTVSLFHEGLVTDEEIKGSSPQIIVVDDLMTEKANDPHMHNLFTKVSHHRQVTVIYITQNMYEKGQCKMKRNAHYLVMMRNPSDKSQLATLGRQLYPRKRSQLEHFYEAYDDATKEKYGYLLIDVSPDSIEDQKLKTGILPDKRGRLAITVYQPK